MPTRGHGRNVARYSANVRPFTRVPDAKLTQFEAGTAILLRKCTFATRRQRIFQPTTNAKRRSYSIRCSRAF
jgi:hypothetical protein